MHPLWTITDQSSTVQIAKIVQNAIWFHVVYSMTHNNVMSYQSKLSKRKMIAWFDSNYMQNQFNRRKKCNEKRLLRINKILLNWSPADGVD